MKEYFELQFKLMNRKMIDFGLPLLIGYTLIPLLFYFSSNTLFEKTEYAHYLFIIIALSLTLKLNEYTRNDFLKSIFSKENYIKVRILENIIYCLPFSFFLIYKGFFVYLILLNILTILISFLNFDTKGNLTIPTPFSKTPFEFTVGFRKTFYIFPITYYLTYISISVNNFNLGAFNIILIGMICYSYYSKLENEYFIWNYNLSSKEFLLEKLRTCLNFFSLLCLPIIIPLAIYYFNKLDILILLILLCYVYLTMIIFAKYSSFPNQMNISQAILIALSFGFPPIIIILIPFFYRRSIKSLKLILND